MKKTKSFITILIILVSVAIAVTIIYILLDNTGKINQGNFRLNDLVVQSTINVQEEQNDKGNASNMSDLSLGLSQLNTISMLIPKNSGISKMYISNVEIKDPAKKGNISFAQKSHNAKYSVTSSNKVEIYYEEKADQYYVELNIDNENFSSKVKIPDGTKEVTYDGTLLKLIGLKISDIQFEVKFNINIVDKKGNSNICKMKFKLPDEQLINNGISIVRENTSDYVFSVKNNI